MDTKYFFCTNIDAELDGYSPRMTLPRPNFLGLLISVGRQVFLSFKASGGGGYCTRTRIINLVSIGVIDWI